MTGLEPKQSTNFLVEVQAPFDARLQITKLADLASIPYPYKGMIVSVTTADNPLDNGIWYRTAADNVATTVDNISSTWIHLGIDTNSITSSIPEVANLTALYNIGDPDPAVNEEIRRAYNMVLIVDYNSTDTKSSHTPSYSGANLVPMIFTSPIRDINGKTDISDVYWENLNNWSTLGMLKKNITVRGPGIGLATPGKVFYEGTEHYNMFEQLLTTRIHPVYAAPSLTLSPQQILPDGSTMNITFTITYIQGNAGSTTTKVATLKSHMGSTIAMGSIVGNTVTFYNIPIQHNDLVAFVTYSYLEGEVLNDNLDSPSPDGHILAGSVTYEIGLDTYFTAVRYSDTLPVNPDDYIAIQKGSAGIPLFSFDTREGVINTKFVIESVKPNKSFVLGVPLMFSTNQYKYKVTLESSGANITSDIVSVNSIYYNELGFGIPYQTLVFNGKATINDYINFTFSE